MTDTLAARLRAALVGDYTGDVMPFDELKPEIQARWQRVADVARTRAEVPAPIRVPFSDAQIERMAKAAREVLIGPCDADANWPMWYRAIRAALAAGGLEPCAVPDYDPADVALAPTGHVLRDRLVDAEAKIERQRKNLHQLYEARERDAQLIADLRAEVDEDNAAAASVNDLLVQVQNLTAERDALRERASVPIDPTADQVESLARALREAHMKECHVEPSDCPPNKGYLAEARAAIAHLSTRPDGLPTAEELRAAHMQYAQDYEAGKNDGALCATDFALDYLRPWLHDPVGCEMDVTEQAIRNAWLDGEHVGNTWDAARKVLDLCRSRIRPVYECKECAKCEAECRQWRNANDELVRRATAARAALEGE